MFLTFDKHARADTTLKAWKDSSSLGLENDRLYVHGLSVTGNYRWFFDYLIFKDTGTMWCQPWGELAMLVYPNFQPNYVSTTDFEVNAFTESDKAYLKYSMTAGNLREELVYTIYADEPYIHMTLSLTNVGSGVENTYAGAQFTTWIAGDHANDYFYVPGHGQGQFTGVGNVYFPDATETWIAEWDQNKGEGCGMLSLRGFAPENMVTEDFGIGEGFKFISDNFDLAPGQTSETYDCYYYFFMGTGWQETEGFSDSISMPQLTVISAYDSPSPTSGVFPYGTSITTSVTSPVAGPAGTQYVCTGWTGTGDVPASGTGTTVTFTINQDSSITWNWKMQYYLTVNNGGHGTASGENWYDAGTPGTFSISPTTVSDGTGVQYVFTGWSSNDPNGYIGSLPSTAVTMNNPITETANWKTQYYLAVKTEPSGAATIAGQGWYDASATPTLTAPSVSGSYRFWGWDVDGTMQGTTNPINVQMNGPHTATAHYSDSAVGGEWAPIQTAQATVPYMLLGFITLAALATGSWRRLRKH